MPSAKVERSVSDVPRHHGGADDGTRTRDPHLGKVMLYQLSHFRSIFATTENGGAESQNRTGDTAIFSRVLYQLSYLGPVANQALAARRRVGGYHGASRPFNGGRRRTVLPSVARTGLEGSSRA